jgi:Transposase IS66 family
MSGARLHAADTPAPVLAPGAGRTKTGRLWAYLRDERPFAGDVAPAVLHRYNPDRKSDHPRLHLAGFTGVLHADGYSGFASPTLKSAADTGRLHWDRTQRDNTRIQSGRQSSRPHAPISAMMAKSVDLGWSEFSQCRRQS